MSFDADIPMRSLQCGDNHAVPLDTVSLNMETYAEAIMRKKAYGEMYADKIMRWPTCGDDNAVPIMRWQ